KTVSGLPPAPNVGTSASGAIEKEPLLYALSRTSAFHEHIPKDELSENGSDFATTAYFKNIINKSVMYLCFGNDKFVML
ncbi:hypothetical protein A2U01_0002646, partial [Trifolium medium]|nr:hypothetical protein [Trifolium medium]